jgi:small subunit ribosomal protein S6
MRRYETFVILDPDLPEDQRLPVIERVKETMAQLGGFLIRIDEWGSRKLAYAIKKKERGYYVRLDFCGTAQLVNEMERFFRIDERVLKHMSVLLDPQADIERIQADMAKAEAEAQKPVEGESAPASVPEPAAETPEPQTIEPSQSQQEA